MISRKLHSRTKIFFPNPYVVRIQYINLTGAIDNYRKIIKNTYNLIKGTWGYSTLEDESVEIKDANESVLTSYKVSMNNQTLGAFWGVSSFMVKRGYICFKDEIDAMQFRLMIDANAIRVNMWPVKWFTIHEYIEIPDEEISDLLPEIKCTDKYT